MYSKVMKRSKHKHNSSKLQKSSFVSACDPICTEDAIKCLFSENTDISKERILRSLSTVEEASSNNDLSSQNIIALVDIIGSQKFGLQFSMKLMKCLFIQNKNILENALINAVSWICTQRLHIRIQTCFLKWILEVYDTIEDKKNFSYLYGVMFNWVELDSLAPLACQLLCKMTEKHHVAPFRVRHLLDVMSKLGPQLHILALLSVFSHHRQDLITIQSKAKSFFRSLNALPSLIESQLASHQAERRNKKKDVDTPKVVMHKHIRTFTQLYDATQDLNTPKGLEKLLSSPKRRILFTSGLSPSLLSQFSLWLRHSLTAEKHSTQSTLKAGRGDLLMLASNISEELQCSVLQCYTNLYQRWALWEVRRHETCRCEVVNNVNLEWKDMTVFGQELRSEVPYSEVKSLATYVDRMCTMALQLHPDHPAVLLYQIMTFFEVVIQTHSMDNAVPLFLPSSYIISAVVFSSSAAALNQLCKLIISYKEAVDNLRTKNLELVQQQLILTLNSCIMDICNTLWRCQAFKPKNNSVLFQKALPEQISQSVSGMCESFSLYYHPAFFGLALTFLKQSEEEMDLQDLLNDKVIRKEYLSLLSRSGLKHTVSFIRTFIKLSA